MMEDQKDSMKTGSFFMGKVSEVRGCALTNPENKSLVYNGKRREEKKIEKKFDCTQRAVLIWMKIWNV